MTDVDLTDTRQPREHAVTCQECYRAKTFAVDAICDRCKGDPK